MGRLIDEAAAVANVNAHLAGHNFTPRDADGNDFQYGDDTSLRFKTGTVYGEVSVQVVKDGHTVEVIRILRDERVDEGKHRIDAIIAEHVGLVEVEIYVEGQEEPIATRECVDPEQAESFASRMGHPGGHFG